MGNRNMAGKRLKLQRQRRLFPRYLSADYVPTGKPPNQLVMRELKERSRSLAFDDEYAQYLAVRHVMDLQGQHPHPGRAEVLRHIQRIQNVAPSLQNVVLHHDAFRKVRLFYNEDRSRFILFQEELRAKFVQTSMVYMDRTRCIAAFKSDTVRWVHFSSVHPPPHESPKGDDNSTSE